MKQCHDKMSLSVDTGKRPHDDYKVELWDMRHRTIDSQEGTMQDVIKHLKKMLDDLGFSLNSDGQSLYSGEQRVGRPTIHLTAKYDVRTARQSGRFRLLMIFCSAPRIQHCFRSLRLC